MLKAVNRPVEIVERRLNFKAIFLGRPKREKLHVVYVENTRILNKLTFLCIRCLNLDVLVSLDSWGPLEIVKG